MQSNYIPWRGYFDLIASVDEFILYDDVQYTKNDWRNRNRIKTPKGVEWISIPVSGGLDRRICDVEATDRRWPVKHWKTLEANYRKAPGFSYVEQNIAHLYLENNSRNLSDINRSFIEAACKMLCIDTKISDVRDYDISGDRNERLVDLCSQIAGEVYVSGPAAKDYLETHKFKQKSIEVEWFEYPAYPEYQQLWGDFRHDVSILDLLFNAGEKSGNYMRYV